MLYKELEKCSQDKLANDFCILSGTPLLPIANQAAHNTTCIVGICTQGNAHIQIHNQEYILAPDHIFILMPGLFIPHVNVSDSFNASYFALSTAFFHDVIKTIRSFSPLFFTYMKSHVLYPLPPQRVAHFTDYCRLLKNSTQLPQHVSREAIMALIRILFLDLYNDFEHTAHHRNVSANETRKEELTHDFYALMTQHYREHKEVTYYAEKLNVSSKYLTEVVKETSGRSPKNWIIEYALLEIKELLKNTSASIQEITYQTKFASQSSLSRFFRRHTQLSPSEYRESIQ